MVQVIEIFLHGGQAPLDLTELTQLLLMGWRCKDKIRYDKLYLVSYDKQQTLAQGYYTTRKSQSVSSHGTYYHDISPYGITDLSKHWFRLLPVAYLVPSHYLTQCLHNVSWTLKNKIWWNFKLQKFTFKNMHLKMSAKCQAFCSFSMFWRNRGVSTSADQSLYKYR